MGNALDRVRTAQAYNEALKVSATFGADAGYRGVLASHPIHSDYQTSYPRTEPYALDRLASVIPKGWHIPKVPTTAE